jgi:multidrug efflux pump subunit AcrB
MWIVRLALRRPYTFVVAAIALILLGAVTIVRMPTDIFPEIDIPVVSVIWSYNGISPEEMERRIMTISERAMTTTVNGIEHMESTSLNGVGVIRIFFQPGTKIEAAVAQVTAINQTILRIMPPGTTPPLIIRYSASNVPILQAALGSEVLSEQSLYDIGLNFIRTRLATVQGAQIPLPYGGKARQVMVDLDPKLLTANTLSPADISAALATQNVILPAGTARLGGTEYNVRTNSSPDQIAELADVPIRQIGDRTVYLRDVAEVRDGFAPQNSMVHVDGARSALLTVLKSSGYSTLDIVSRVKEALPRILATVPAGVVVRLLFDQSVFVRAAIDGVLKESLIAGGLTALMILMFLGSWRSTLIIAVSIPLSMLVSIVCLAAMGYTLNTMTLGGLALAVGVLVDDATVEIENIHRNLAMRKPLLRAILDGAEQIALPAFVSTIAICIVFVPVLFITGAARFLFVPLSLAVIVAMLASYLLSRTLVPTMVRFLLAPEVDVYAAGDDGSEHRGGKGPIWAFHRVFNKGFEGAKSLYEASLAWVLTHRALSLAGFVAVLVGAGAVVPFVGRDFFPSVDAGQFRLHVRCPAGTRIEESERYFLAVEGVIRETIPPAELELVLDNIGLPPGGVNLAFSDSSTVSAADGEIMVSLTKQRSKSTSEYAELLRPKLAARFPELTYFFQSADIVSQILNFGISAPIDVQVSSPNRVDSLRVAKELRDAALHVHGASDVRLQQVPAAPELRVTVDRSRASQIGLVQRDVASSLLTSLSGSGQASPTYWLNPANGVSYLVSVQTPFYRLADLDTVRTTPMTSPGTSRFDLLESVAEFKRGTTPASVSHYNVQPVFDVLLSASGADLGHVGDAVESLVKSARQNAPKGLTITVRGQYQAMNESFSGLSLGLIAAVILVYCLMVINFQSWTDPFIIIFAVPGAVAGVVVMLAMTRTTFSVPALMGAIMCVGVATANSILLVTFANGQRRLGQNAMQAAFSAGSTRLRPVIMTAAAMIIGMIPMSLGLGEGGEQNAPLARAVIGGLLVATVVTLLIVPAVYSILRRTQPRTLEDMDVLQ